MLRAIVLACAAAVLLPTGWRLSPPQGLWVATSTMPQGIALSPDGSRLAVLDSGYQKPMLQILNAANLRTVARIPLPGGFGRPIWLDANHLLIAGGTSDAALIVNARTGAVRALAARKGSWPAAIAFSRTSKRIALAEDGSGTVQIGSRDGFAHAAPISVGAHPSDVAFSPDGRTLYAAVRQPSSVVVVNAATARVTARVALESHPSALALSPDGSLLYVAESDADAVAVLDTHARRVARQIAAGLHAGRAHGWGASPNALALHEGDLFVSLGAENAVARIAGNRVVERIPAGWYPSAVTVAANGTLFVADGKGEGAPANPRYRSWTHGTGYVAFSTVGSVRRIARAQYVRASRETRAVIADAMPRWTPPPGTQTVLRANGPIEHVFYVIKENRSYDQVLGDLARGNNDLQLVMYGERITPNQHALARRFGIFDNTDADSQVSADGHNWTDAAFANDYVERFWPVNYAHRRALYDMQDGRAPDVPHSGYLWDAAHRAGVTFRDYGEDAQSSFSSIGHFPGLRGYTDPHYMGWDLSYSDLDRYAEWLREFKGFVEHHDLPQFEIVYLPNDHTWGTKPGAPTPDAYVATNDWAVGQLVDTISHSPYWDSSAIFIVEDDAQNGPDHVSDQRTPFYVASPYAIAGVHHDHYSTAGIVRSMELILGLPPLSIYDATARPLYAAFATARVNAAPFTAVKPAVDLKAKNAANAYGARRSSAMNFAQPDAADPAVLNDILAHAAGCAACLSRLDHRKF